MSLRRTHPHTRTHPHLTQSRLRDVLAAGMARGTIGAYTEEIPFPDNDPEFAGKYVFVTAKSAREIKEEMQKALAAARSNIAGDRDGQDQISVRSEDARLLFSITITFEHGGSKGLIGGNVGGKPVALKTNEKITDEYLEFLATVVVGMFAEAGGQEHHAVKIEYSVQT